MHIPPREHLNKGLSVAAGNVVGGWQRDEKRIGGQGFIIRGPRRVPRNIGRTRPPPEAHFSNMESNGHGRALVWGAQIQLLTYRCVCG